MAQSGERGQDGGSGARREGIKTRVRVAVEQWTVSAVWMQAKQQSKALIYQIINSTTVHTARFAYGTLCRKIMLTDHPTDGQRSE